MTILDVYGASVLAIMFATWGAAVVLSAWIAGTGRTPKSIRELLTTFGSSDAAIVTLLVGFVAGLFGGLLWPFALVWGGLYFLIRKAKGVCNDE